MMKQDLTTPDMNKLNTWIFDLDNTLYPRHCDLFAQIDIKMTEFIMDFLTLPFDEARKIQKDLYCDHGTTLRGLIANYHIDPSDFLQKVHDIDYSHMPANPELRDLIKALPGRKLIFTNGDTPHAERTLAQLQLDDCFDAIFDIVAADYDPKPAQKPYDQFIALYDVTPETSIMFEDMPRNLEVPKAMGMQTVLILPQQGGNWKAESWELVDDNESFIDHRTDDLNAFLKMLF